MHEATLRIGREPMKRRPVISSWSALLAYVRVLAHEPREQFRVLFLDKKNQLIADEVMNHGTVDHAPVYPREIMRRALELSATAVILVHNHPSGDPDPPGRHRHDHEVIQAGRCSMWPSTTTLSSAVRAWSAWRSAACSIRRSRVARVLLHVRRVALVRTGLETDGSPLPLRPRAPVADDDMAADRRAADRRTRARGRALLGGRILHGPELRLSLDVRLRDVSDQGARAILPAGQPCPPAGVLMIPSKAQAHRFKAAWVEGGQVGLAFETSWDLQSADLPAEAKGLRRLWVDLTLR